MTPKLEIALLGGFRLMVAGELQMSPNQPRQQALLAYLLLHQQSLLPRHQVAFDFWPDSTERQAFTNLRKLVFQLRQSVPAAVPFIYADNMSLGWQGDESVRFDVRDLEMALAALADGESQGAKAITQIVELYRGELFPACYEEWIAPLRQKLHDRVLNALEDGLGALEAEHAFPLAIRVATHLLHLDPLREESYRSLMRLRVLSGDRAGALQLYHECVARLEQELDVSPVAETQALYRQILKTDGVPASAAKKGPQQEQTPLVGRQAEWVALQQSWHSLALRGPSFVCIWGEAGAGKTRLIEELVSWARLQSGTVAISHSYAAEGSLAFAPLTEWLRTPALADALESLENLWLTELARLLPELLSANPGLAAPVAMSEAWQRQRFHEALARAILAAPQPILLILDDAHWCDEETLTWLRYLIRFAKDAHLLIVGTVRSEAVSEEHPLPALIHQLQRSAQYSALELAPLNIAETVELAGHLTGRDLSGWATRLFQESEGNPLFVVEMVRAGLGSSPDVTQALPPTIQAVIHARLNQLSPAARQLAQMAAAIGRAFTLEILASVSNVNLAELGQILDELWQRRILREQGQGFDFNHDKIREVAYATISPMRRQLLHGQVATTMETIYGQRLGDVAGQIAFHYELGGNYEKAQSYFELAGDQAQRLSANQEALRYYNQALALVENRHAYYHLLALRAQVYLNLYLGKEAVGDFRLLNEHAKVTGNRQQELDSLLGLANGYYLLALDDEESEAFQQVRSIYMSAQALARQVGDKRRLALSLLLPIWHFWPEYFEQASTGNREALRLSIELGDEELIADSKLALLYNAHELEQAHIGDQLLVELEARHDLVRLNSATFYLMWTHYNLGNLERAVVLCDKGIEIAAKLGVLPVQYHTLRAFSLLSMGDYGKAYLSLQQEVVDETHLLSRAFQKCGLAMYYFEVGAHQEALPLFEHVIEQAERLHRGWLREWARLWLARTLISGRERDESLLRWTARILSEVDKKVISGIHPWHAKHLLLEAEMALARDVLEEALRLAIAALGYATENGLRKEVIGALELKARIHQRMGQPTEALALVNEATVLSRAENYLPQRWQNCALHAQVLQELGEGEAANCLNREAVKIIEKITAGIGEAAHVRTFTTQPRVAKILAAEQSYAGDKEIVKPQR